MKRSLIYVILLTILSVNIAMGAGTSALSEASKATIMQSLSDALQSKRITQEQYAQAISWVHATPCDGVGRGLTANRKAKLATAIKKQLELKSVDVLQSFQKEGWTIVYVDTHISDEPYLFYASDPIQALHPVTQWSGAAMIFETSAIEHWVFDNAPGIPQSLASCFAWEVTLNHD